MRIPSAILVLALVAGLAACDGRPEPRSAEFEDLNRELVLALTAKRQLERQVVELNDRVAASSAAAPAVRQPVRAASRPRTTTAATRQVSSAPVYAGTPPIYQAPAPRTIEVKNTKRDAAIGAGAGAVIGAVAGGRNNRVKGAVIGAAVGGVAGAVIGSTVDKSTRVVY